MSRNLLIVLAGPTAVGKTAMAIDLAIHFGTEIISADSRQLFRELTIGTAKPTQEELHRVKHHFIDTLSVSEEYDAGMYGREALQVLQDLFVKHRVVLLCGGSGLYVKAVTEGFDDMPGIPPGLREQIMQDYKMKGMAWLQKSVEEKDPDYFAIADRKNPQRLMRALELSLAAGTPGTSLRKKNKLVHDFEILKIGLELDRDELYHRIDKRMDQMIEKGLFEEARHFYPHRDLNALQTVGYREIFDYMDGLHDRDETIRLLKRNSRRYAKRQLTWFKKDQEITWFNPSDRDTIIRFVELKIRELNGE